MSGDGYRIVFEDEDGYPRELIDAGDHRRAIGGGTLKPDTIVTLYRNRASPVAVKAIDIPELRAIFEPPTPASIVAEPAPAPPPPSLPHATRPPPPPTAVPAGAMPEEEVEVDDYPANDFEGYITTRRRRGTWPLIVTIIVVGGLLWMIIANSQRALNAPPPTVRTYTAALDVNARTAPEKNSQINGIVHRGEVVSGELKRSSSGQMWLEIRGGPFAGSYIWRGNLVPMQPPSSVN